MNPRDPRSGSASRDPRSGSVPRDPRSGSVPRDPRSGSVPGWAFESIFHFTVNATNFERSLAFYQTLGFQLLRDNRDVVWPPFVAENFGMTRAQGRGALLALGPGPEHTRIDLIEWLEPAYDPAPDRPWPDRVPRIIALRTRNVRAAVAELRARGIAFPNEPRSPGPESGIVGVACCRDPDGLIVELIEYEPGLLGSRIDHLERRKPA